MSDIPATPNAIARGEACCVCRQSAARVWRRAADNLLGGPTLYTAVKCDTCGTVRLSPRPDAETMRRAYSPQTYARAEATDGGDTGLAKRLDVFFDHQAERAIQAFSRFAGPSVPQRVLDVGCGDGRFLRAMTKRGWDGVGLETDPHAAALARNRSQMPVHESPLETAGLPAGSFGMVSLLHVLEHVPDPRETLRTAFEMLAPGGILLLALPNAESLEARLFGAEWYQLDLPRHFWGFGPKPLARLVQEVGFTHTAFRFLPFFFVLQSLRNRLRKKSGRPLADAPTDDAQAGQAKRSPDSAAKNLAFATLLVFGQSVGRYLPGEVMELAAVRPAAPDAKTPVSR